MCPHFFCLIILLSLMYIRRKSQTTVVTPSSAKPEPTFKMVFFRLNLPPLPSIVMMNCEENFRHYSPSLTLYSHLKGILTKEST